MYSATVLLSDVQFSPIGKGNTTCTIAPPHDISAIPAGVFGGDGQNQIIISPPKGYTGSVQLIFQLPDPNYMLLGLAFENARGKGVGRNQFPTILINRDLTGSQITLTDACVDTSIQLVFECDLLVQQVSTQQIGLIDPQIINDPDGP